MTKTPEQQIIDDVNNIWFYQLPDEAGREHVITAGSTPISPMNYLHEFEVALKVLGYKTIPYNSIKMRLEVAGGNVYYIVSW